MAAESGTGPVRAPGPETARDVRGARGSEPAPRGPSSGVSTPKLESNVVSLVGREGFRWQSLAGDLVFQPYMLVQASLQGKYVDDEGLDLADPDNVVELGFGTDTAILGFAGQGFERVSFNLALNAACAGAPCLLNQAWFDLRASEAFHLRVGKQKTPMFWTEQTRIGQRVMSRQPASLTTRVNLPYTLDANDPLFATGFDTGALAHGELGRGLGYQLGIFNGEGAGFNGPTSTTSDDTGLPGLLYSARVYAAPLGAMVTQEGGPVDDGRFRVLVAASASYNVEANSESSDDTRMGGELVLRYAGWYWAAEGYGLRMAFSERQQIASARLFWGGYSMVAHLFSVGIEPVMRMDLLERNSTREPGLLLLPALGLNYYFQGTNAVLRLMGQTLLRSGHSSELAANDDDNQLAEYLGVVQMQFAL